MKFFKSKSSKKPTNKHLSALFQGVDLIQIKSDGVSHDTAISSNVVLKIADPEHIAKFEKLITIEEPEEEFYCMCMGDHAIELLADSKIKATIGLHHGVSIRYHEWQGDAMLQYSDEFLLFLQELGLGKPYLDREQNLKMAEESDLEDRIWLDNSPACFSKYWDEINDFDTSYFPDLLRDLEAEFPDGETRIIAVLHSFGTSSNLWTGYSMYEAVSQKVLDLHELQEVIDAYLNSSKNHVVSIGLGRYLFSWDYRNELEKHLGRLTEEVLAHLAKAFAAVDDSRGLEAVEGVRGAGGRR
jgi:hypothetical protein